MLETHSHRVLEGVDAMVTAEEDASKDVKRRLEALGYKE